MFSNRRFGYGSATFGYGGGRISRSFMDGISARTSLLGLWSTARRTWSGYSGAILRARRSSDNAEKDFYPNGPQGEVSTAELRAWNGWNITANSSAVDRWTGRGTSPPTVALNQTHLGEPCAAITFPAGTASGYATSRADRNESGGPFIVRNGVSYVMTIDVAISRPLVSAETLSIFHTGAFGGSAFILNSANTPALIGAWTRITVPVATVTVSGTNFPAVFCSGAIGASNVTLYVKNIQVEVGTAPTTYEPRTTTGAGDSFLVTLYEQAESGRNLLAWTEDLSQSVWTKVFATITTNTGTIPGSGSATADRLVADVTLNQHRVDHTVTTVIGQPYTFSFWAKPAGYDFIRVRITAFAATIDLVNGTASALSAGTSVVVGESSGGWRRIQVTATATATSETVRINTMPTASTADYSGDGVSGVDLGQLQVETGTTATTYERRTTHGAGTRLNFTQSTTTLQPIICEQGVPVTENGRLAAKFVAADARRMSIASSTAMFNALHTTGGTVLSVHRSNDTANVKCILANKSSEARQGIYFYRSTTEQLRVNTGRSDIAGVATDGATSLTSTTLPVALTQVITATHIDADNATAADRGFHWVNGSLQAGANSISTTPFVENSFGNMTLGSDSAGAAAASFDGTISEVAAFSALIGTTDRVTLEDRAGDFYGVTVTQPITITTQPTSLIASPGQPFTLTCVGTNVQTYNWQFRNAGDTAWSAVGVQTSALTVTATDEMNGREYRCVLINPNASATSNTATITIEQLALTGLSITSSLGGAWSTSRKLLPTHSTAVIRVRRDSDNAETDLLGVGARGEVDTNALRTFNGWNLFARTAEFDHTYWTKTEVTISNDAALAPDGTLSADRITETTNNAYHRVQRTLSFTVGAAYTFSIYVKKESSSRFLLLNGNTALGVRASLNLDTLEVVNINGSGAQVVDAGNGWYRFSITGTALLASSTLFITMSNSGAVDLAYLGDGSSFLIWGAQLEQGASVSTYEPRTTTGAGSSFLVTKYDQTGQARHFTQATTTLQPIVCEQGVPVTEGGRLSAKYVAADARRLSIPSSTAMFNYLHTLASSALFVCKFNDTAATKTVLCSKSNETNESGVLYRCTSGESVGFIAARLNVGGSVTNGTSINAGETSASPLTNQLMVFKTDPSAASCSVHRNGSSLNISTSSSGVPFVDNANNDLHMGARPAASLPHDGTISEVVIAPGLISDSDRDAWESRTGSFFGVSVS